LGAVDLKEKGMLLFCSGIVAGFLLLLAHEMACEGPR
jgi:hypothetical protein